MGWSLNRNVASAQATEWPSVKAELGFSGKINISPQSTIAGCMAAWTDASLAQTGVGGIAVIMPLAHQQVSRWVAHPHSSTQCELNAMTLALKLHPEEIFTDSLGALQLIKNWHNKTSSQIMKCPVRTHVRHFIHTCWQAKNFPFLEKVKAHDTDGLKQGIFKQF
jgi:ribonuclease HI